MKNWFLAFGLLGMVLTTFAQELVLSGKGTQKMGVIRSNIRQGEFGMAVGCNQADKH